jgi:DNA repair exonuclease SbcCD ATPase subunit
MAMPKKKSKGFSEHPKSKTKLGVSLTPTGSDLLDQIAKKAELSKSELVDHIARGEIAIASPSAEKTVTLETDPEAASQQQTTINVASGKQPPQNQSLGAQDSSTVTQQAYETLKQELEQKANLLSDLENQLAQQKSQQGESNQALEQELEQKADLVSDLENQLAQQKSLAAQNADSYQALKRESEQQANQISALQQQIADLQRLATIGEAQLNKWRYYQFSS